MSLLLSLVAVFFAMAVVILAVTVALALGAIL